jgi:putative flippase GtrA
MIQTSSAQSLLASVEGHIPPGQFGRYLLVGLWNTAFGYGIYAGLTALLTPHIPYAYMIASLLGNFLSITSAFLAYKWFVFKTTGQYLREWLRCMAVYGCAAIIGISLLPVFVFALRRLTPSKASAPYIAGAALTGLAVIASFVAHKNFSFARRNLLR